MKSYQRKMQYLVGALTNALNVRSLSHRSTPSIGISARYTIILAGLL
jgi:hypothetical protein